MLRIDNRRKPKPQDFYLSEEKVKALDNRHPIIYYIHIILCIICIIVWIAGLALHIQSEGLGVSVILYVILWTLFSIPMARLIGMIIMIILWPLYIIPKVSDLLDWKPCRPPESYFKYKEAISAWEKAHQETVEKYPNIEKFNFEEESYTRYHINKYIVELQNKLKDNLTKRKQREEESWWERLSPRAFEEEIANYYTRLGYTVTLTRESNDGGVDVIAKGAKGSIYIQCKHYSKSSQVPVSTVRELKGVMAAAGVTRGAIATLYGVTSGAKKFAQRNGISILSLSDYCKKTTLECVIPEYNKKEEDIVYYNPYYKWCFIGELFEKLNDAQAHAQKELSRWTQEYSFHISMISKYYIIIIGKETDINEIKKITCAHYIT